MPELKNLPEDIYRLFDETITHEPSEANLESFATNLKDLLRTRLAARPKVQRPIRFSSLGKPDRQVWFDAHPVDGGKEVLRGSTYVKFLYGDVIEQVLLFLAKESGHEVTSEQMGVELDGITGSIDAIIDGTVVDVKSASPFGYAKFRDNKLLENDPFGYVYQLAGYSSLLRPNQSAAWLAMDKVAGEICITPLDSSAIKYHLPAPRIAHLKSVVAHDEPPALCYQPEPDGKSGNMKLPTPCSYCSHKFRCHPGVRTFLYSNGPRYLTTVAKLPDVFEVTGVPIESDIA